MKLNAKNERIKRAFFRYLKHAKKRCDATVSAVEKAVLLYQDFSRNEDLGLYNPDRAIEFKAWLSKREFRGKPISGITYCTYLKNLRVFFEWLAWQPGYKSRINPTIVDYLSVTEKEDRMAAQRVQRNFPPLDYVVNLAESIQPVTEIDLRDRALISFTLLSGMRDHAVSTLPIGCFDENTLLITQNPVLGVATKFSKYIPTNILPFHKGLLGYVLEWVKHLKGKGFGSADPMFPRSKNAQGPDGISFETSTEVERAFWRNTSPMRKIFKRRACAAGLHYFPPHTFRHLAFDLAFKSCKNGEEIKAISQNFGHEHVATSLSAYANFPPDRLASIIQGLNFTPGHEGENVDKIEKLKKLVLSLS